MYIRSHVDAKHVSNASLSSAKSTCSAIRSMARFSILLIFSVCLAAEIYASDRPCKLCLFRPSTSELNNISLRLYPNSTLDDYISVPIGKVLDLSGKIDPKKPTIVYISGWTEHPNSLSVKTVLGAYFKRQDHNVLLLDYSQIAGKPYPYAIASVKTVGPTVATAIDEMVDAGQLNSSRLHIVGHSLGGQVARSVGKAVKYRIARITGLDPAGPFFDPSRENNMSANDAEFVDVIHTDAGQYGSNYSRGNVTSYINGGSRVQPGCPPLPIPFSADDFCSHHRSWYYYAESVLDPSAFMGVKCDSEDSFRRGSCSSNPKVAIGFGTRSTASGNFYLQTNSAPPYGRGERGAKYEATDSSIGSKLSGLNPFG